MTQTTTPNQQHHFDPHPPYVLALDIGTSSVRALLFDATGLVVPHVLSQHPYSLTTSKEGESSVDAGMLVDFVAQAIDEALAAAGPLAAQIGAVATDTFWHSLLAVDDAGRPLTPVISWEDTRPRQALTSLCAQLDETAVHRRTGAHLHASYWPAKLRWLAATQPAVCERTAQWLSFGEYLHRCFLGRSVCSLSMASGTGMLDIRSRTWDSELEQLLGVRPGRLPALGDLHDSLAGLRPEFAERWPALRAVPWFPAIGDGAAANVGSGCAIEENWALTVGASSAIRVLVPLDTITPSRGLWLYLLDARRGLLGGALSEGGNIFAWLETVLKLPPLAEAEALIAGLVPDAHGLTVLPFISGERSPGWHIDARMALVGINTHTSPVDILHACIEALAYQLNAVYEELIIALEREEIAPTLIGSGGALLGSPTLQAVIANVLNTPLYPAVEREASARGAALLALEAMGVIPDVARVPVELEAPVLPEEDAHAIYQLAMERQQRLYRALLE